MGVLVVSSLGYLIYVGTTGGGTSSSQLVSTTQTASAHPAYVARTESASISEPTCSGLNASQTAANEKVIKSGLENAYYDAQYWYYVSGSHSSLSYNVVAQAKDDGFGYGPLLLVNGATSQGYWYQAGLAYNFWNYGGKGHANGFQMFYQVYRNDAAVWPYANGSTESLNFTRMQSGDTVTISLAFQNGNVTMSAADLNTGETLERSYYAYGATYFIAGDPNSYTPTSLMTEWPHVEPYLCLNTLTHFSPTSGTLSSSYVVTNVWNFTGYSVNQWWNPKSPGQFTMNTKVIPFTLYSGQQFYLNYMGIGIYVRSDGFYTM